MKKTLLGFALVITFLTSLSSCAVPGRFGDVRYRHHRQVY